MSGPLPPFLYKYLPRRIRGPLRSAVYIVVESQRERALTIVSRHLKGASPSEAGLASPWRCAACGEEIEGQFRECWKCGSARR